MNLTLPIGSAVKAWQYIVGQILKIVDYANCVTNDSTEKFCLT